MSAGDYDYNDTSTAYTGTDLVRPNEPDQPDPNLTRILTLRANPTQLNLILDPEGPTRHKSGSCWVHVGFIKYIIGLNLNLNPF